MNAVRIHTYGGPEVLVYESAPRPIITPDELLVRVHAASVNSFDCKMRTGNYQKYMPLQLPAILGVESSGTVEEVGANVKNFKVGDDVLAWPDPLRNGTYAEYVAVKPSNAAPKPKSIDHVTAATVPIAGMAAWTGLVTAGKLMPGQRVLIHGAAGGVGTFAVQIAKLCGAHVIGTASKNIDLLREIGVDEAIDYVRTLSNLSGVAIGVSSKEHARDTFTRLRTMQVELSNRTALKSTKPVDREPNAH